MSGPGVGVPSPEFKGVELLTGIRITSTIYRDVETNYVYKKQSHRSDRNCTYFICTAQGCTGTAIYKEDKMSAKRNHNHEADMRKINSYTVLNRCKERAANENTPVKQIFKEEMLKFPIDTPELDIRDVESSMVKYRRKDSVTEATCDIHEFIEYLGTSRYGKTVTNDKFFKDHIELPDGSINVIFISPGLVHLLVNTPVLYIDPSNKAVPTPPDFSCLLIIYAADMGLLFPVSYVFVTHESVESFTAILKFIREIAPSCNPGTIITGFDSVIQTAVRMVFGEHHVEILGDFRHYAQMLKRKLYHESIDLMNTIKSNDEPAATIIKSVFSLPLLPATRCIEGIQTVRHQTEIMLQNRPEVYHKTRKFLDYIEEYWFNTIGIQSVFEKWKEFELHLQVSTFNTNFLRLLFPSMRTCNSIWNFVEKLIKCEDRELQKFTKSLEGQKVYQQRCKCITKERLTKSLITKLERNEIYVWNFLTDLTELTFVADDLEAWSMAAEPVSGNQWDNDSMDSTETFSQTPVKKKRGPKPASSYSDWSANSILNSSRPEQLEVKPSIVFNEAGNAAKPSVRYNEPSAPSTKKKKKKTASAVNTVEQSQAEFTQHLQRQNEILASLLAQTNILYETMAKTNASQNNRITSALQPNPTHQKQLLDSINIRAQQLANSNNPEDRPDSPLGSYHCRMCNEKKVQILFRPCGHMCTCKLCWESLKIHSPFCLMCQERVVESIRVRY